MQEILGGRKQKEGEYSDSNVGLIPIKKGREKKELGKKKSSRLQHSFQEVTKLMESPWAKTACWKSLMSQWSRPTP